MKLTLALLSAGLLLAGCASFDGRGLTPGQSAAGEVDALMGPAADKRVRADGETWLYYPRQPYGMANYVARMDRDGKLLGIEDRLSEDNIARLARGTTTRDAVLELLGPAYRAWSFPRMPREVLEWRFRNASGQHAGLYVQMTPDDGIVREVFVEVDPDARKSDALTP
jgi:hypothetical protein